MTQTKTKTKSGSDSKGDKQSPPTEKAKVDSKGNSATQERGAQGKNKGQQSDQRR